MCVCLGIKLNCCSIQLQPFDSIALHVCINLLLIKVQVVFIDIIYNRQQAVTNYKPFHLIHLIHLILSLDSCLDLILECVTSCFN